MDKEIVLIPGALSTPQIWKHQAKHLASRFKIHYLDVINSESIEEMAKRFLSIAPPKFSLIGFSMGGYIALELIRLIPERIEKLVLINSAARLVSEKGKLERERSLELIHKGKFDFLIKLIFKNSIYNTEVCKALLPFIESMAHQVGSENYIKQLNAILNKSDHSSLLTTINCPTLLIASKEDMVMPNERSEHMSKEIKNSELRYINQCGHMAMLEQPELVNQILSEWL